MWINFIYEYIYIYIYIYIYTKYKKETRPKTHKMYSATFIH